MSRPLSPSWAGFTRGRTEIFLPSASLSSRAAGSGQMSGIAVLEGFRFKSRLRLVRSRSLRFQWSSRPSGVSGFSFVRSEEHTSELQSLMRNSYAVFCLKKKNKKHEKNSKEK